MPVLHRLTNERDFPVPSESRAVGLAVYGNYAHGAAIPHDQLVETSTKLGFLPLTGLGGVQLDQASEELRRELKRQSVRQCKDQTFKVKAPNSTLDTKRAPTGNAQDPAKSKKPTFDFPGTSRSHLRPETRKLSPKGDNQLFRLAFSIAAGADIHAHGPLSYRSYHRKRRKTLTRKPNFRQD
jgi:hypothetical protein